MSNRLPGINAGLAVAMLVALFASLCIGRFPIAPGQLLDLLLARPGGDVSADQQTAQVVLWQVRGPRVLASAIVGAALAASGVALQSVFRNPLAAPDLLGVSAGAALGAVLGIFLGWRMAGIQTGAFVGGLFAVGAVWLVGVRLPLRDKVLSLVLTGIAIGSLLGALIALIKMLADPYTQLPAITFWLLGSFASVEPRDLPWLAAVCVLGAAPMVVMRWQADALALSDDEARTLGVRLGTLRGALVLGATLVTAASVATAGIIGWVGLVVPHAARLLVGAAFSRVLPVAMLLGALLMVVIDTLGRSVVQAEIPPGVLTALIGAPALFLLMIRRSDD
jgi:iron complex transport system permease protein